mmetsp:Transcript_29832/g.62821  ORF Transcript_29832/g.62821 Transcript_29832/m.62821 type:complete len:254 (-) Transcript_29832:349-1110(-)
MAAETALTPDIATPMLEEAATSIVRADGRLPNQLRPLVVEPGALSRADGSARFSHDKTSIIAAVYGPCEVRRVRELADRATLELVVRPRSGASGPRERELEQLLLATLNHVVVTSLHPRTAISIVIQIAEDDGSLLSAALNAACIALMHAGVPLHGFAAACTIAVMHSGDAVLDPSSSEQRDAVAVVTISHLLCEAPAGQTQERRLLLSHVEGTVTSTQYDMMLEAALQAGQCVAAFCRSALQRGIIGAAGRR